MKKMTGLIAFLLVLLLMPIGHIVMSFFTYNFSLTMQVISAGILGFIGFVLIILFSKTQNEIIATLIGVLSGVIIWTGWVEFSFVYFFRKTINSTVKRRR